MLDDFPKTSGPDREAKIIECVKNGRAQYDFVKLTSEHNGHKAEFLVFEDALKIDGIRVNVTATTQQQIADLLDCILPTAKIYDLMWSTCENRLNPYPRSITSSTDAMIAHSKDIDVGLSKIKLQQGCKSTVGKTWVIDNSLLSKPGKACNYGWHFDTGTTYKGINGNVNASLLKNPKTGMYWYVIQPLSWMHDPFHSDYSQVVILVSKKCWVDGKEMSIIDVLQNSELAWLANHSGILNVLRQPNVPELDPIVIKESDPEPEPVPETVPEPKPILPEVMLGCPETIYNIDIKEKIENKPDIKPKGVDILTLLISILKSIFGK